MERELEVGVMMDERGTVTVAMGPWSSSGLIFFTTFPSPSVDALLCDPPCTVRVLVRVLNDRHRDTNKIIIWAQKINNETK